MIVNPLNMSLHEWADRISLELSESILMDDNWQDWGAEIEIAPDPYRFTDWKEWAERFCEVMS